MLILRETVCSMLIHLLCQLSVTELLVSVISCSEPAGSECSLIDAGGSMDVLCHVMF